MDEQAHDAVMWAVGRWRAEVANRPLINVHRRTLDDTWRQVIRHFGGDPGSLIGPSHDALLASDAGAETRARLAADARRDDRMADALRQCVAVIDRADTSEGVCGCGESMNGHSPPMDAGHMPVDVGDYRAFEAITAARAALAEQPQEPARPEAEQGADARDAALWRLVARLPHDGGVAGALRAYGRLTHHGQAQAIADRLDAAMQAEREEGEHGR